MVARLLRMLPLFVILAVLAVIIYLVVSYRQSPNRAKEVLLKIFLVITGVLTGVFLLGSLYALLDGNTAAFELVFACFIAALICLVITLVCRYVFLKHHPSYRKKPMKTKHVNTQRDQARNWFEQILQAYQNAKRNQNGRGGRY